MVLSDKPKRTPLAQCRAPCTHLLEPRGEKFHCAISQTRELRLRPTVQLAKAHTENGRAGIGTEVPRPPQPRLLITTQSTSLGQPGSGLGSPGHPRKQDGPREEALVLPPRRVFINKPPEVSEARPPA